MGRPMIFKNISTCEVNPQRRLWTYDSKGGEKIIKTLKGLGTLIVPVSYISRRPKASPSNIDGPILLKIYTIITLPTHKKGNQKTFSNAKSRQATLYLPICFDKEGSNISVVTISKIDASTTYRANSCDLSCFSFRQYPFPYRIIAHCRHCTLSHQDLN